MRFAIFSAASLVALVSAAALPSELDMRQSSYTPIDTTPLMIGACLSIGSCYYNGMQDGCYTPACGNSTKLGKVCSCNVDVQAAIETQMQKGENMWPVKCPY